MKKGNRIINTIQNGYFRACRGLWGNGNALFYLMV